MTGIITSVAQLIRIGKRIYERKLSFLSVFALLFLGSVSALAKSDLLPNAPHASVTPAVVLSSPKSNVTSSTSVSKSEEPLKIDIPTIKLAANIMNPTTTDITALDQKLLSGAVRYPTSALLGETGNVVLFGHSSYLPVVGNQAYKTFNNIQKLVVGDEVTVYSANAAYTYAVRSVTKESTNTAGIPLAVSGRVLTLSTCDSFGEKTDRFVVVADFVESHSISG